MPAVFIPEGYDEKIAMYADLTAGRRADWKTRAAVERSLRAMYRRDFGEGTPEAHAAVAADIRDVVAEREGS